MTTTACEQQVIVSVKVEESGSLRTQIYTRLCSSVK